VPILQAPTAVRAVRAKRRRRGWIAVVRAVGDDAHRREQGRQGAHSRAFAGAAVPHHHHPADRRIDGAEQQRQLEVVLPDQRGERVYWHASCEF
jgi:hypothetical protein